ncbi:hypothetical protein KSC_077160 [Ktedonobacter sp. SOSP1-52]|uniref:serine/threonine-protein kinase n=1 Tax=Ktedonobacter sp. SOSP1-52 TaxID=2778366 RepID=UPI0019169EC2|nr:serine/threonine-protein kinase [Ktedonobacter sp. SOSP1-52]GHO68824.1 hypothetical protein KSC_077160 [Ktedonobacter sp. SOSP1-52]
MRDIENTIIAHYAIQHYLAKGGMSEIYLARDLQTQQDVAIKMVHSSNEEYCRRFQREARAIASLQHEHILPALDYGEYGPWCYLVTPYIANGTLRDYMQREPFSLDEAGDYLAQIASALQHAHEHGIIHRDIKASNILMRDKNFAYLADFGLVKSLNDTAESLTESGYLIGTAEYMAPELAEEDASPASDIYSLGILLYQMLTGDVPFKGATPVSTFMKHLSERPPLPSRRNRNVPKEIEKVVLRALAKEPGLRYPSARAFAEAYQQALAAYKERIANDEKTTVHVVTLKAEATEQGLTPGRTRRPTPALPALALALLIPFLFGFSIYMLKTTDAKSTHPIINGTISSTPKARAASSTPTAGTSPSPTVGHNKGGNPQNVAPVAPARTNHGNPVPASSSNGGSGKSGQKDGKNGKNGNNGNGNGGSHRGGSSSGKGHNK